MSKPNIIVILADDLGWGDLSCYPQLRERPGVALNTPNLDRLASEGVRCTDAYATASICAPSRAGLMTGRNQQRFGYYQFYESICGIPRDQQTIAELLKENGYATALFGKWHSSQNFENGPLNRGFQRFFGFIGGQHDYYDPRNGQPCLAISHALDAFIYDQDQRIKEEEMEYLTDAITHHGIEFMEEQTQKGNPFFLYLPYNTPHPPLQAKKEKLDLFYSRDDQDFSHRDLARAMITSLDESVGKVMDRVKELGIEENTLVFFSSDNGGHDDGPEGLLIQHNGGLRSRKGFLWEGGIRVPMIVRWTGHFPAGMTYGRPVSHLDIFATAASAAGIGNYGNIDGTDLAPYLNGMNPEDPHEALYWGGTEAENKWAVRKGDWKLISERESAESKNRVYGLYDLKEDWRETVNVIDQHPEIASDLLALKEQFYRDAKPSLVPEEADEAWRKERDERLKERPNPNDLRRRGYPGCWIWG